jgi:hypothetical protein
MAKDRTMENESMGWVGGKSQKKRGGLGKTCFIF